MRTTNEMIEVMKAYSEGKTIECKASDCDYWVEVDNIHWNWDSFDYRVKPEPKYVPYASVSEIDRSKWVKDNDGSSGVLYMIDSIDVDCKEVHLAAMGWVGLCGLFNDFVYEDGTPCGKLVEE